MGKYNRDGILVQMTAQKPEQRNIEMKLILMGFGHEQKNYSIGDPEEWVSNHWVGGRRGHDRPSGKRSKGVKHEGR